VSENTHDRAGFGRRALVQAAAAAALLGVTETSAAAAPPPTPRPRRAGRVDVHHHATPPKLQDWLVEQKILPPDKTVWPRWARWDLDSTLQVMEDNDIAAGVASTPAPFDIFRDAAQARAGARVCNESLAELVRSEPGRFGFFAYLPLPYVDAALEEAAYALDELGADGVLLMTHAGDHYLGDPAFDPVFEELDRRRAVIFTHPFGIPGGPAPGVPDHLGDFLLDTTRAAIRMILAGTLDRFPHVSIILSHAGGFLPYMAGRFDIEDGVEPERVRAALRRFYYDTALPASPYATPTLLAAAGPSRVLFGTDWNANSAAGVARYVEAHVNDPQVDRRTRRRIDRDNALRLFPRLAVSS
jgi:6-methylsalicylate decarboxylase